MSGKTPFFLTGGNARILLNNKTVAYATDLSYKISVKHAAPRVLGRFEVEVVQPLAYDVTGTLTIIKYGRGMNSFFAEQGADSTDQLGNGIGSYSYGNPISSALGFPDGGLFDGATSEAFNPSRFFQSRMFTIEIRQKLPEKSDNSVITGTRLNNIFNKQIATNEVPATVIRGCRFEDMQFQLNKKGVATMLLTFRARYIDEDTFIARKSGVGQELM